MNLQETIKNQREALGLTQKELSQRAKLTQATISRLESGDLFQLQSNSLSRLASALNITIDYLVGNTNKLSTANIIDTDPKATTLINYYSSMPPDRKRNLILYAKFLTEYAEENTHGPVIKESFGRETKRQKEKRG
jgi:transcriptional regulator with XRE-family HTH domain